MTSTPTLRVVTFEIRTNQIEHYKKLIIRDKSSNELNYDFNRDLIPIISFLRKYSSLIESISTSKKNHFLSKMKIVLNFEDNLLATLSETESSILFQFSR